MSPPEVPWPAGPYPAIYDPPAVEGGVGWLTFVPPGGGGRASIPVWCGTKGAAVETFPAGPVWEIRVDGDTATTHPSVHAPDRWHTPNPAHWRLVDELPRGV